MVVPLRVVMLEDSPTDAELLAVHLEQAGFDPQWTRVDTVGDYLAALREQPDVILADYTLPQMTALDALHLLHELGNDTPAIVVSGVMDEETCVQALRHGAVDYLLKDRLARLGPAVEHALQQQQLRAAQRRAEQAARETATLLQAVVDGAPQAIHLTDRRGRFLLVNKRFELLAGLPAGGACGAGVDLLPDRDLADRIAAADARCLAGRAVLEAEETTGAGEHAHRWLCLRYPLLRDDGTSYAVAAIWTDITRQKLTEQALREAREELQRHSDELSRANTELTQLDQLKNQFIATVSHELRTPLTSIRGYTEILTDREHLSPAERRIVGIIDANGQRLLGLIEELLTFARMEQGQIPLQLGKVDVADLVERGVAVVTPAASANGISLATDVSPHLPVLSADPGQLERVLLNLLSNAVKFSPDGGTVTVAAHDHGDHVTVRVQDQGIGIPPEEQGKLFTRFFRSQAAERRAIPGTGLGLAICKVIVEAHGGWITAHSAPGTGTTMTVGLPYRS